MEEIRTNAPTGSWQRKRMVLIVAAVFSALLAPFLVIFDEGTLQSRIVDFVSVIGFGILMLGWCYFDSLERREPLGTGFRVLIVIFGLPALFIYLIKSRGFAQGLRSIGKALLFCVGMFLIMMVSAFGVATAFGIE